MITLELNKDNPHSSSSAEKPAVIAADPKKPSPVEPVNVLPPDPLLGDALVSLDEKETWWDWISGCCFDFFEWLQSLFCSAPRPGNPEPLPPNPVNPKIPLHKVPPPHDKKKIDDTESIRNFYIHGGVIPRGDCKGLTREQVLKLDDAILESRHNFIQWLFVSDEPSRAQPGSPVISLELIGECKENAVFMQNLSNSFEEFIAFYGFTLSDDHEKVSRRTGDDDPRSFEKRSKNWITKGNHNYDRISRILHCLMKFGLVKEAGAFYNALAETWNDPQYQPLIGERTFKDYWTKEATPPTVTG